MLSGGYLPVVLVIVQFSVIRTQSNVPLDQTANGYNQQRLQYATQQSQWGQRGSAAAPAVQGQPEFQYDAASFAVTDLARRIGTVLGQQNNAAVFSPVSIACALSLLLLAASKETKQELIQVLNYNPDEQSTVAIHRQYGKMLQEVASTQPDLYPIPWRRTDRCSDEKDDDYMDENQIIHLANAIFVKQDLSISNRFVEASRTFYNSSINKLDFSGSPQQSASRINRWASESTFGKINQIVPSYMNPDTQMIVANALYFKGLWKEMFEKQVTTYRKFYPDGHANPSTAKDVLSMAVIGCFPSYDAVQYDARIVGLPYQGDKTTLYIIIPNNSTKAKLQRFQSTLTAKDIGHMVTQMRVRKTLLQIPKMKISNTINLREVLQKLNLRTIFNPASSDLSGLLELPSAGGEETIDRNRFVIRNSANSERLYASDIIHKVELEINEKGTEGGAITASTIFRSLPSVQVRVDVPFLMLLGHDATRLPLFYGSIYDPTGCLAVNGWYTQYEVSAGRDWKFRMRQTRILILLYAAIICYLAGVAGQTKHRYATLARRSNIQNIQKRTSQETSQRLSNPTAFRSVITSQNDKQLSQAIVDMALNIGRLSAEQNSAAEISSPVSIMGVLNMLLLSADGTTRSELLGALKLSNSVKINDYHRRAAGLFANLMDDNPKELERLLWKAESCVADDYDDEDESDIATPKSKELRIATGIFAQNELPISENFVTAANQLYGANTQKLNFRDTLSATSLINKWVNQATNGRIREITRGQLQPDTSILIASSLYFKATWETEFTARSTRSKDFFPDGPGRSSVKVDTMNLNGCLPYTFQKDLDVRVIGLPYSDNATTMYVLMPQNSTRAKVRALQNRLTATRIDSMISGMKRRTAIVNFPRMQLLSSTDLEKSFRLLGVKSIFSAQHSDLRFMLNQSSQGKIPLYVSQISHKVNLNVDERGTEGAAVTVTLIDRTSPSVIFNANQPFLIYVRHDPSRLPLFYGAVFNPKG
ncbi:uncharacterized protein LOC129773501 [Toxorhynchites rutilus septentrionalis]|uniref:uncharacterized protein LOC129773501 n=1 Tax=Toxorhynchites rutilus septentrionalis TaxID=329112 RepID=UPI002479DD88|nr:uncharacterized protein LOC129773501 [Toxorhynchites rutilus septentrionalis]